MKAANARTLGMWSLRVFSLKPRTVMSSIMRARNALTGRGEEAEVIAGVLFELKVAGPSMLGIDAPIVTPYRSPTHRHRRKCTRLDAALPRERVRCVPSMFDSLGVEVPYPT